MSAGTDTLYNEGQKLIFTTVLGGTSKSVAFKAFLTNFSDNYESNWERESAFGRMDDIQSFRNTKRTIDLSWEVVADSKLEAKVNLAKVQKLIRMLYPSYTRDGAGGYNIQGSPLVRIKFINLITTITGNGLLGSLSGMTAMPNFEEGTFFDKSGATTAATYPKVFELSCTFYPLHEELLGWVGGKFKSKSFPYNINTADELQDEKEALASFQQGLQEAEQTILNTGIQGMEDIDAFTDKLVADAGRKREEDIQEELRKLAPREIGFAMDNFNLDPGLGNPFSGDLPTGGGLNFSDTPEQAEKDEKKLNLNDEATTEELVGD